MSINPTPEQPGAEEALALLERGLDAVASVEWWRSTGAQVSEAVGRLEVAQSRAAAAQVAVLAEVEARGLPAEQGAKNLAGWLRAQVPITPQQASARAALAVSLPGQGFAPTWEKFAAGGINAGQAGAVVRTLQAVEAQPDPPDPQVRAQAQDLLLDAADRLDASQLGKAGRYLRFRLDPDAADRLARDEDAQAEAREAYLIQERTGMWLLRGVLPPAEGAALAAAIDPLAAPRPAADGTPDPRTARQRTADAICQLARLALTAAPGTPGALPTQGGSPTRLILTAQPTTLLADLTHTTGKAALAGLPPAMLTVGDGTAGGWEVSPLTAQTMGCDAETVPILIDDDTGRPLDVGTTIYPFPPRIRRAIELRDGGCTWPGCTAKPPWCDAHHLIRHPDGPTSETNGALLCRPHHRYVHAHGLRGQLTDGHVHWPGQPDPATATATMATMATTTPTTNDSTANSPTSPSDGTAATNQGRRGSHLGEVAQTGPRRGRWGEEQAEGSPMAELLVDFITSLDGYAAAEGWPGYWGLEGPEYLGWLGQSPENGYTILMGATTYRLMSGFAATSDDDSFAQLTTTPKVVFSSTLAKPLAWANTRLVSQDPVEAVRVLKAEESSGLRTVGSLTLCRSLLQAGLVDRFRVVVFPVITGATGRERIYDGYPDIGLEMITHRTFDGRLQLLEYTPTLLTGPGSPAH